MKKLVFIIDSMRANGAQRVMSLLVNEAAKEGMDVLLVFTTSSTIEYSISEKVRIVDLSEQIKSTGRIKAFIKRIKQIRLLLKKEKPDAAVSFLTTQNIYTSILTRGLKIPAIISERADPRQMKSGLRKLIRNFSYDLAEGVIFQTEDAKSAYSKKTQKKSIVIPNPVKDNLPLSDRTNTKKWLVAVGRLDSQKNYPMLLDAFQIFNARYPDYELHIFGDGADLDGLIKLSKKLKIRGKVFFEGLVTDLHDRIKDATMYLLSSDYEGISNSLLEALAMGLPCVSTDCPVGGSRLIIQDGISGILTPVGASKDFAEAMCKIAASKEYADMLSGNAVRVRREYATDVIVKRYLQYVESICDKR